MKPVDFKCEKCNKSFKVEKKYQVHVSNKLNPCDYVCVGCNYQVGSRASWDRHKKECEKYKIVSDEITKRESAEYNTYTVNSTDGSYNTTNNTNNQINNNLHNHNNNNLIMLNPFGYDHIYMDKDKKTRLENCIGSIRGTVIGLVKDGKYEDAYEKMFQQIHGNTLKPEFHNIYMDDNETDKVYFFNEARFNCKDVPEVVPGLTTAIHLEINWLINSSIELDPNEKDKLTESVDDYFDSLDCLQDPRIRRLLFNNRDLVKHTIKNNHVILNNEIVRFKNGGKNVGVTHRITLP